MILDLLYGPDGWFTICPPPDWWHRALAENKAPFPWFGGKSKVVDIVWDRFGEVKNYVEPLVGSMAVLLGRPHAPTIETVNDYDGFVSNFWRAIQSDPDKVADFADWPVNEADLHARHKWLVKRKAMLRARLLEDPTFYDARIAGWWVWGLCAWIGAGWCQDYGMRKNGTPKEQPPMLSGGSGSGNTPNFGQGIHSKSMRLPHLGAGTGGEDDHACAHYGKGVHGKGMRSDGPLPELIGGSGHGNSPKFGRGIHSRDMRLSEQLPDLGGNNRETSMKYGRGIHGQVNRSRLHEVFRAIAQRLRYARITCGDFERILSPAVTWRHGTTGVLLDPPYPSDAGSTGGIYSTDDHERETFARAFRYCVENGANKDLRIALCYYEGTIADDGSGATTTITTEFGGAVKTHTVVGVNVSDKLRSLGWEIVEWLAGGGYSGQSGGNDNRKRERIAFSPHCIRARQGTLF